MRPHLFPRILVAVTLPLLASCASFGSPRDDPRDTQLVATDEPLHSAGVPTLPAQARDDSVPSDFASGAAHLAANDGQWHRTIHDDDPSRRSGLCGTAQIGTGYDPLTDGGVYRGYAARVVDRSWIFVGLALGGDGVGPVVFGDPCGEAWLGDALGSRVTRMAPEVTARDTSLLFTTRGRALPTSGGFLGAIGGLVERFAPQSADSDAPRTAKPRDAKVAPAATPTTAPAPNSANPAAIPSATPTASSPVAAPDATREDRRTSTTPSGGSGRPRGQGVP